MAFKREEIGPPNELASAKVLKTSQAARVEDVAMAAVPAGLAGTLIQNAPRLAGASFSSPVFSYTRDRSRNAIRYGLNLALERRDGKNSRTRGSGSTTGEVQQEYEVETLRVQLSGGADEPALVVVGFEELEEQKAQYLTVEYKVSNPKNVRQEGSQGLSPRLGRESGWVLRVRSGESKIEV